jgi:D-alanyl-D-alanine carboxypeptidase
MVLLGSKTSEPRYKEAVNLFEEAFNEIKTEQKLFAKGADIFKKECKGGIVPLKAILNEDIDLVYYPSEPLEIETKVNWFDKKLPIQIGDCVGVIEVLDKPSKSMVIRKELYAQNFVEYTLMYKISSSMDTLCGALFFYKYMILLGLGFFIMAYIMSRKSSSQKVK